MAGVAFEALGLHGVLQDKLRYSRSSVRKSCFSCMVCIKLSKAARYLLKLMSCCVFVSKVHDSQRRV